MELRLDVLRGNRAGMGLRVDMLRGTGLVWS